MSSFSHLCYLALGSNIGDRFNFLQKAINFIEDDKDIQLIKISSVYETIPMGNLQHNNFFNAVIEVLTYLAPIELLTRLKDIETIIGRSSVEKWGPREIDIDILFYDNYVIDDVNLKIPHPGIYNRDFVLIPLKQLNDKLIDPKTGKPLLQIIGELKSKYIINKFEKQLSHNFKEQYIG